jgi:hypothetical protein
MQIRQGIEPGEVVDRLRVTEPSVVQSLRLLAAQCNVERGYDVVSQRAGLNLPAGDPQELELERRSARTAAFRQVLQGHDAGGAALALGISDQIRQEVLEPLVAWLDEQVAVGALTMPQRQQFARCILGGDASDAVLRGECVQAVASRCGITTPIAIDALQAAAASFIGLSFATGDRLCDRMAAAGVTTPERTRVLERTIAITHGQAAVTAGDQPLDVARRLQLTRPESLRSLAEAAAMRDIARGNPVPVAAERHGIDTDDAALMRELELHAVHTHGRRLLLGGMAIELVRERLGLRQREADDDLRVLQQLQG